MVLQAHGAREILRVRLGGGCQVFPVSAHRRDTSDPVPDPGRPPGHLG